MAAWHVAQTGAPDAEVHSEPNATKKILIATNRFYFYIDHNANKRDRIKEVQLSELGKKFFRNYFDANFQWRQRAARR